ncbi:MAG: hypothetical protein MI757_11870, partial [Pirellulales bacterium]|nr:hypothetical protein [Pirellulales bacterium]
MRRLSSCAVLVALICLLGSQQAKGTNIVVDTTVPPDISDSPVAADITVGNVTLTLNATGLIDSTNTDGGAQSRAVQVIGTSTFNMNGGTARAVETDGAPRAFGVDALSGSTTNIAGGLMDVDSTGGGAIGYGIDGDNAQISLSGGTIDVQANGGGAQSYGIRATNSVVNVTGGLIDAKALGGGDLAVGLELRGTSTGTLSGGNILTNAIGGGEMADDIRVYDDSTLTIFGSSFNLPFGEIAATSGDIIGTLADGTVVNFSFLRSGDAADGTIILAE